MTTITIPKRLAAKDLIIVAKEDYEALTERASFAPPLNYKTVRMSTNDKRALEAARRDYRKGNFVTIDVLKRDLARRSQK